MELELDLDINMHAHTYTASICMHVCTYNVCVHTYNAVNPFPCGEISRRCLLGQVVRNM